MSVVAGGTLGRYRANGWPIPLGWVLDAEGQPTADPAAVDRGGSLAPIGGHKGYGLALALDVLSGVLSGGRFGAMLGEPGQSYFVLAVRIDRFMPEERFLDRMDQLIAQLQATPPAPGSAGVTVPGERAHRTKLERLANGVPLDEAAVAALKTMSTELGLRMPAPL